jgi:hypothetical protein
MASPGHFTPGEESQYPFYRRPDGLQFRPGRVWKISPTPRLDFRIFESVASRYTDYTNLVRTEKLVTLY